MPHERVIGRIPVGSIIIRLATMDDVAIDPTRLVLYRDPDGVEKWLPHPDDTAEQSKAEE